MGQDTLGFIRGYASPDAVLNVIREIFDKNAVSGIRREQRNKISLIDYRYAVNPHSQDDIYRYAEYGYIDFCHKGEQRSLFYSYSNINAFDYNKAELCDMAYSETTRLVLSASKASAGIMEEIIAQFGGGWIDENDCDENAVPYWVHGKYNSDAEGEPAFLTHADIERLAGDNVTIL